VVQRKPKIAAKKVKRKSAVRRKTVPIVRRKIAQHVSTNANINVHMSQQIQQKNKFYFDVKKEANNPVRLFFLEWKEISY